MPEKEKLILCWSGGKDSTLALYELLQSSRYKVVGLLTTLASEYDRVSHHGVRAELLESQAKALGFPLEKLYFSTQATNLCQPDNPNEAMSVYEDLMRGTLLRYKNKGVFSVAFGDIFLEPLRAYRENNLAKIGMKGVFPLWKRDTKELMQTFIRLGFRAILTCVDGPKLGEKFAGRHLDSQFLQDLPADVDPCGENGEYHSFVYDGPMFNHPVRLQLGEIVPRDTRFFADLVHEIQFCNLTLNPA
jgi:uncharacterized protein (TIGR00290 family)